MKTCSIMNVVFSILLLTLISATTTYAAVDLTQDISAEDQAQFDEILTPVMKIYNMIKYAASAIAAIALLFAAIAYMTSGSDPRKRDTAKNTAGYVIMGLFIIWATPYLVNFLIV